MTGDDVFGNDPNKRAGLKFTTEKKWVVEVNGLRIEVLGNKGEIRNTRVPSLVTFDKTDLEDLMAAFNWLYHETKGKT